MGGSAYGSLEELISEKDFSLLYNELSEKFPKLVDILTAVSHEMNTGTNKSILNLYEKWLKTGNELLEKILAKRGIIRVNPFLS
jgi:hypothetical protein